MHKLFRSLTRNSSEAGVALPFVFESFRDNDIKFFPGDLSMIAGPPGSGKSTLAMNYARKAKKDTLYISSDMPQTLFVKRLLQMELEEELSTVEKNLLTPDGFERYKKTLRSIDHLYMDYPARPDAESVAGSIMETIEILGTPPSLVVVDNLMNLDSGKENEWAGLRELAQVLKYMAKELDVHVQALHHTHIGVPDLSSPVPYSNIMGKIAELPSVILTVAKRPGQLLYAPVKNRYGRADATASIVLPLAYNEKHQIISDKAKEVYPSYASPIQPVYHQDWRERSYKD